MEVLAVLGLYIAGVIGAGFASGQEIVTFFVRYGKAGLGGIMLSVLTLTLGTLITLELCARHNISSYHDLFGLLSGGKRSIARSFDLMYSLFLFSGVSVMLAGAAAIWPVLRYLTALLVYLVLQNGKSRALSLGAPLALLLVLVLAYIALTNLVVFGFELQYYPWWSGLDAGFLYASYNLGFALALLVSIQGALKTPTQRWLVSVCGNLLLGLILWLLYLALTSLAGQSLAQPVPGLSLAQRISPSMVWLYQGVLWVAMYTTALTNSLALVTRFAKGSPLHWSRFSFLVSAGALLVSYLGFVQLINYAYPLLGLAGIWIIANLIRAKSL